MKRAMVLALCLMLMASSAYAKNDEFFVYDEDEHDYEGRVVWSSNVRYDDKSGNSHDAYIWHTLNLKTGKYTTDEMRDSYIIMDDGSHEGFLTAREDDGCVSVFNVTGGYDSKLLFAFVPEGEKLTDEYLRVSVIGYMEGYLYYIEMRRENLDASFRTYLKRTDMKGDVYTYSRSEISAINKNGTCAWDTGEDAELYIESPEKGVFMRISAQEVDGAAELRAAVWLNENKLLFWAIMPGEFEGTLYSLNINTGKVKKYLDRRGNEIRGEVGYSPYWVMMDINEEKELVLYMDDPGDQVYCDPTLWDLTNGKCTILYVPAPRLVGPSYRKKIRELAYSEMMIVWIRE